MLAQRASSERQVLANKSCLGTRATILLGILIQSIGFSCLAYSAGFRLDSRLVDPAASATAILGSRWSLRLGLLLLGLGDALAMTPVMEDIMTALRGGAAGAENDPAAVNAVGALLTASFGLGQVVGPLLGTELAESFGFGRAAALMGAFLLCLLPVLFVCGRRWPARVAPQGIPSRGRIRRAGFALVEPVAEEGVEVPSLRSI
jgi:MFS family permease